MNEDEKLAVVIPVRFSESMARELTRVARSERKRPTLIRNCVAEALARRRKAKAVKLSRAEEAAITELRSHGATLTDVLRAALPRLSADPTHPQA